jgi:putative ABC transport system permease protein
MRFDALVYFYRRRLRVHAVQELLAGLGVAIAVALVLASTIASASIAGSAAEVVHTVVGPATLQLRSRGTGGFEEGLLSRVERLPGIKQAGPLLEQTATIRTPNGKRHVTVNLAGADTGLVVLDGLAHTLPIATLSPGGLGLSTTTARALGLPSADGADTELLLSLRGTTTEVKVSAILGRETFGALSGAQVAVMPLADLQRMAGLHGRLSRILVQTEPGREAAVRSELRALVGTRIDVTAATQDVAALRQALRPSNQASDFFAAISALLGFLLAFTALLLTVPERRQTIAELRLNGTKPMAIVQMFAFQALVLGVAASLVGVLGGYFLSLDAFHLSTGYLAAAFTLSTHTVVGALPVVLALFGGILATCLASTIPLLDLRGGRPIDAVYAGDGVPGNALSQTAQRRLGAMAAILLAAATALFVLAPSLALLASGVLALASVCVVPVVFIGVLRVAGVITERYQGFPILSVALTSLRSTTLRSLALAATGAVALFGSVALGGARSDLLRGIHGFARSYSADASIWVTNPGDNQATSDFSDNGQPARIAKVPGVAHVNVFQGGFLQLGDRRVWVIARPLEANRHVLENQVIDGNKALAITRLGEGGWIVLSKQIAEARHVTLGKELVLPTPTGERSFRVAATTTNLAWAPGVIFMGTEDYSRFWGTSAPTALGVQLLPGTNELQARRAIARALGSSSGLEVAAAAMRESSIDTLANEGLGQLGEISTMLLLAAILALSAAGTSAVWQRRYSLAQRRLDGVRPRRLRRILLVESVLMLGAGCATGAIAGIYGQIVIDGYLKRITGFPVASLATIFRPLEIFALVIAVVVAIVTVPGWFASRVSPMLALND